MTGAGGGAGPDAELGWQWDVALSFAGAQRPYVEQVAHALKARGVRCFYDADEQIELWGKYLAEELPTIYAEQTAAVVVFVSAEYAARDWTRLERRAALNRAVRERREYVLPARFYDTPLPGLLSDMVAVDLRGRTPQQFAAMIGDKLALLAISAAAPSADARAPARDVEPTPPAGAVRAGDADPLRLGVHAAISVPGVPDDVLPGEVRGALPELPPNHVARPELLGRLRAALLDGTGGGPRRVGVWGMGGSGKSVLAAALMQDAAVRRRFPDGLAWVRLEPPTGDPAARQGMLAQRQQGLVAKLTPPGEAAGVVTDLEQGRDRLAELLRDRACLVVVDNAWTADDVYAFSVLDRRGGLLVTTRDAGLVRAAGAVEVKVAELRDAQARTLAADWAGVPEQSLPPSAAETLRLVGNLALGVATVAALARGDGQRWAELADRLRRAELATLELQFPGYPHPSLLAALQLGLDYLDPSARRRYGELAVFAGRGPVPRPAVEALWAPAGVSATDAGDLLAKFGNRALLRRDPVTGWVDLHDLQFDVARADLDDLLSAAHGQLLAGYAARCPRGWPSGPDDSYFYQQLAGHLAAAGRRDELAELLTDVEWMRSRLRAGGVTGLLTDYTTVPDEPGLALVQATIRLSAHVLAVDPDELPTQLAGRTIGRYEPELARVHAAALAWPHAAWLCPIRPTLAQPGEALRQTLTGHTDGVWAVAVSADGRTAVSGGDDGTVRVWDLAGTAAPRALTGHDRGVWAVAVSADGRTAVSGGDDGTVRVWDLAGTAAPRALTGHDRGVWAVAVSADGRTAVRRRSRCP